MILTSQNLVVAILALGGLAKAQDSYHLFNPVPRNQMRPLAADRPDATESAQTVDAGHIQLEMDIAAYLKEGGNESFVFANTNLKFGLLPDVDLQLVFAPYVRDEDDSGHSNLTVRVKWNLWGNDGETRSAFALLPYVDFSTGGESLGGDHVTGGIITPFSLELSGGWGLGGQLGIDLVRNAADDGYELDFSQTIVVGHEIGGPVAGFVEFASVVPAHGDWIGTLNLGLTYAVNEDVQFDVATFVGISDAAPDFVVLTGITWRF